MSPQVLEPFANAVELSPEQAVTICGMRDMVGLSYIPHGHSEHAVRVLQPENPIVHRDKEGKSDEQDCRQELDSDPCVHRATRQGRPEPGAKVQVP